MSNTKKPDLDDASHGGGIGDIPAQPVNPSSPHTGQTDPVFESDDVGTEESPDDAADEAEGQPS